MPQWIADKLCNGLPLVIVAGGESVTAAACRLIGLARAENKIRVIAINDSVYPCWFADIAYACDGAWWRRHRGLPGFRGLKLKCKNPDPKTGKDNDPAPFDDVFWILANGPRGLDRDPSKIRHGSNSGHQAINVGYHLGPDHIILVGFDMWGAHWFGDHPPELRNASFVDHDVRMKLMEELGKELTASGVTVVNASPNSMMKTFRKVDLKTELKRIGASL